LAEDAEPTFSCDGAELHPAKTMSARLRPMPFAMAINPIFILRPRLTTSEWMEAPMVISPSLRLVPAL
jgi:hypothetical protein